MKKSLLYLSLLLLTAVINFSCKGNEATVEIPVVSVELSKSTLEIEVGETSKLSVKVNPSDATNTKVQWQSSNPEVATVSEEGLILGIAEGETTITVCSDEMDSIKDECTITVKEKDENGGNGGGTEDEDEIELTLETIDPENLPEENVWVITDAAAATADNFGKLRSAISNSQNDIKVIFSDLSTLPEEAMATSESKLIKLTRVDAPKVKTLNVSALKGCNGLTEVLLPEVKKIEPAAFGECSALESLDLPKVEAIGYGVFYGCTSLQDLSVNEDFYCVEEGVLYDRTKALIHTFLPGNTATQYTAPSTVLGVGVDAFYDCNNIEEIVIESAYIVGDFSFSYCSKLRMVSLPAVTTIGGKAFMGCTALEGLYAPIATEIGSDVLNGCSTIKEIDLPKAINVGYGAFAHCTSVVRISLPVVETTGIDTMFDCPSLTSLTMATESWVKDINVYLFGWDGKPTKVDFTTGSGNGTYARDNKWVISATNVEIGPFKSISGADENTTSGNEFTLANIPSNGELIEGNTWIITDQTSASSANFERLYLALKSAGRLISVEMPGILNIPDNAFNSITTLKSISAPEALSVGEYAFDICEGLVSVNLPKVESIGWQAFYECRGLTTLDFPAAKTTSMGSFGKCSSLTSILMPNLMYIGPYAFAECSKLATVDFTSVNQIAEMAFMYDFDLDVISMPNATIIGGGAFGGCLASTISVPKAASIGKLAFGVCSKLTDLTIATESTITDVVSTLFDNTDLSIIDLKTSANNGTTVDGTNWTLPDGAGNTFTVSGFKSITTDGGAVTPDPDDKDETAEFTLNTIPEDGSTINSDTWIITDNGIVAKELFVRLQSALSTAGREISVEFPNLTVLPANWCTTSCSNLISVKAQSVTTVVTDSFANATGLIKLELPAVKVIGSLLFNNCPKLNTVTIATTSTIESIEQFAFMPIGSEKLNLITGSNNGTTVNGNTWTVTSKNFTFNSITVK